MPEAQASLQRHLAGQSKAVQQFNLFSGSAQANELFHAVKGKYTDKRLIFTSSTKPRFALGAISQYRNPDWQGEPRESLTIPPLPAEFNKMFRDLESKPQRKDKKMR
jgi:hypothetical protein